MKIYYLIYSFFPLFRSFSLFFLIVFFLIKLKFKLSLFIKIVFLVFIVFIFIWFLILILESISRLLIINLKSSLKYGFILFVFRELIFFFRIFWFFFDINFSQRFFNFFLWPPKIIILINPFSLPLINTFILLGRGFIITIFYFNLLKNQKNKISFFLTLLLALIFLDIQYNEYKEISYSLREGVLGTVFFFSTGFHGFHVFIGLVFLFINFLRSLLNEYKIIDHLSLEISIIYWHFVDVVWLFLFIFIYWWIFLKIILKEY